MDAERWTVVSRHFDELVELSGPRRAERLAALGATDPDLRRQLEALLAADADPAEPGFSWAVDPLGLVGRNVSHFTVRQPLGSGGMGVVYRAEDTRLGRLVALKLPHASLGEDPSWKERFLQEARSAAALDHPNLCQIFEVGETEAGQPFLAMPLYRGETLQERLGREAPLPVETALDIARQVATGLAAMHDAGIVHRDLKPGNVMLLPDGGVKILDFGLAKARDTGLTDPGVRVGTVAYMAPEQVLGRDVDGRADHWALGVVLYEMLTGRKPFAAEHDVSLAHAIAYDSPAPPSTVREQLPRPVENLVLGLLEKEPGAREAARLALLGGEPVRRRHPRRRLALAGAGLVAAAALAWGTLGRAPRPAAGMDENLLVVAPFDVVDRELQLWSEGLVDLLSRALDRAGPLRTVSQSVAVKRWSGRADPASAEELGRRTGAGLVVFGSLVPVGGDSVSLRATVLDRARGSAGPDLEVRGEERRLAELADSLGVRVLRALGRGRPIGAVRHVSIGSRSLPALKEFLRGEQFYRRAEWDSALAHYESAIAEDSAFGLPYRRMAVVLGLGPATSEAYRSPEEYLERAITLNRGLAPRDSLLFAAESLGLAGLALRDPGAWLELRFRTVATLEEAVRRYPDDPEIQYDLGEMLMHWPPPLGLSPAPALAAFDRAIALDPGFTPAYEHTVELAMQLRMPDRAGRFARAYSALRPTEAHAASLRLAALVLDSGGVSAPAVALALRGATTNDLFRLGDHLKWWTDSAETAVQVFREIVRGGHDLTGAPPFVADPRMWRKVLAAALAFRGRLRESAEVYGALLTDSDPPPFWNLDDPFRDYALLQVIPDSVAAAAFARSWRPDAVWGGTDVPRHLRGLPWWLARGDSLALGRFERRAAEVARTADEARPVLRARYLGSAAAAYLALVRGDSARAVRAFQAIPDSLCYVGNCFFEKLTLARLLGARGQHEQAARLLDRWVWVEGSTPMSVLAALARARLAERLGEPDKASDLYRFVAEVWRRADPALRSYVDEAHDGLRRVQAGNRGSPATP